MTTLPTIHFGYFHFIPNNETIKIRQTDCEDCNEKFKCIVVNGQLHKNNEVFDVKNAILNPVDYYCKCEGRYKDIFITMNCNEKIQAFIPKKLTKKLLPLLK